MALEAAVYPVQVLVSSPGSLWLGHELAELPDPRRAARRKRGGCKARTRELELAAMREAALEQENAQLRGLRAALPPLVKKWQLAEIVSVETTPLRQRLVINTRRARWCVHE